jgi:hypothetical protein
MADDDLQRVKLRARTIKELRAFLDGTDVDFGCRPTVRREGNEFTAEVYATAPQVARIRGRRSALVRDIGASTDAVNITVIENASEIGRARQKEIGVGNRFAAPRSTASPAEAATASDATRVPKGLGIKE